MIQLSRSKAQGVFTQIDMGRFIQGRMFKEAEFRAALREVDWSVYRDQRVLIKPCGTGPVPPWAFMLVLANLIPIDPLSVSYGEDCAPVVVYKRPFTNSSVRS